MTEKEREKQRAMVCSHARGRVHMFSHVIIAKIIFANIPGPKRGKIFNVSKLRIMMAYRKLLLTFGTRAVCASGLRSVFSVLMSLECHYCG